MKLTRKRLMLAVGGTALATAGVLLPMTASQAVTPPQIVPAHADVFFVDSGALGGTTKSFPAAALSNHIGLPGTGTYTVSLPAGFIPGGDTTKCSSIANANTASGAIATATAGGANAFNVKTFNNTGATPTPGDQPFDLIVVC